MTSPLVRAGHAALAAALTVGLLVPPAAYADPQPEAKPAAGSDKDAVPGEDAQLYSCHKKSGMTSVTFKPDTELKDLIGWVMGFTCQNFIYDPRIVPSGKKVTVIAPLKMSVGEAYRMFLVSLSTMGLTVVPKGNALRIVESATAKSETVPIYRKGIPPDEDQIVRYVLRPSYAQVETIRQALDAIRSQAGNVQVAGTMLIITDYSSQIRDMMTLAKALDVPGNNEGINTISVKHADATQLAQKLNDILGLTAAAAPGGAGAGPKGVNRPPPAPGQVAEHVNTDDVSVAVPSKILVDERTNTLIVVASEAGYLRVKALVDRLDISLDTEGGAAIHVYPLENALADELATTLNNAMQGQQAKAGAKPGQPGAPAGQAPTPGVSPGGGGGEGSLGAALEGQVRVIGDKPTNSLIVVSTGRDFLAIKDVIRRLDQPRRQVFIEALILEVQLSNETDIGSSSHGGLPIGGGDSLVLGGVQTANLKSLNLTSLVSATGLIGGLIGAPLTNSTTFLGTSIPSYGILFQALANQANTNVLSTPVVIALDNEKAEFSVGNNIPYKAGLSFGGIGLPTTGAGGGLAGSIGQNIQRQKLNLTLNITPHISSNDAVRLEVEQETQDIGDKDPDLGPTWTERKLHTHVVVHDQQSVVIGGLIQEREIYNITKVPLLGDIPILGYLFKYSQKSKKKTNLLILLTPYIIKDQLDLAAIRERKTREYNEFTKSFTNLNAMRYEPRIDYKRKRGVVEEINRAVLSVEQDIDLRNQVGRRQHVQDGPIDYTPSQIEAPEEGAGHGDGTSHSSAPEAPDAKKPATPDAKKPATPPAPAPKKGGM